MNVSEAATILLEYSTFKEARDMNKFTGILIPCQWEDRKLVKQTLFSALESLIIMGEK